MFYDPYKRLFWGLLIAIAIALGALGGQWAYVRLRAAEQAYAFLASAPDGATQSRAQLLDQLLKQQPLPAAGNSPSSRK